MRNPDTDMRNADMDMRIPDTDDVVEVHLKQQQDILKQQQNEYIAEQIEAQQQHEEFQYEKELMKQVQGNMIMHYISRSVISFLSCLVYVFYVRIESRFYNPYVVLLLN
jgi:hypothetical protein